MTAHTVSPTPGSDTYLLLAAFVDELVRCGMTDACTSPGSRCTPIVLTLAREARLRAYSHIDERCSGFFALGLAKATGRPVAVTCTSGTAAANLAPAVIEASEACVPMIVLTADRPPELRGVGAGQTIDQIKLYGDAVRWFFEVGNHEATAARLRWIRGLACRAFWTAHGDRPGPVHLNWPLREPLVLDGPPPPPPVSGRADGSPWIRRWTPADGAPETNSELGNGPPGAELREGGLLGNGPPGAELREDGLLGNGPPGAELREDELVGDGPPGAELRGNGLVGDGLRGVLGDSLRGVVVAGRSDLGLGPVVAAFAARAGYPLLADPLSGARQGPAAVAHYDALLRRPDRFDTPDLVIRVGDLPTSKPLRGWLAGLGGARQIAIDPRAGWQDPDGVVGESLNADPRRLLGAACPARAPAGWLEQWVAADRRAAAALAELFAGEHPDPASAPVRAIGVAPAPGTTSDPGTAERITTKPATAEGITTDPGTAEAVTTDPPRGPGTAIAPGVPFDGLSEPGVAWALGEWLGAGDTLFVAASMPIRDIESFWPARSDGPRVLSNRGANGIDGTVSSAFGVAASSPGRVVLLIGDVALAHDIGGLLAAGRLGLKLTIVLLDNRGGGIFDFLPVSGEQDIFEQHVATPTGLDFSRAAALYGLGHESADSRAQLRAALDRAFGRGGSTLIEVRGDRAANVRLHARAIAAVGRALEAGSNGRGVNEDPVDRPRDEHSIAGPQDENSIAGSPDGN